MISMDKKYRTRDGRPVRVLATDARGDQPVVGLVWNIEQDKEAVMRWSIDGLWSPLSDEIELDLIEVKPRIKRTYWANVYRSHDCLHSSRKEADEKAQADSRLACVQITIDCEEGEGL